VCSRNSKGKQLLYYFENPDIGCWFLWVGSHEECRVLRGISCSRPWFGERQRNEEGSWYRVLESIRFEFSTPSSPFREKESRRVNSIQFHERESARYLLTQHAGEKNPFQIPARVIGSIAHRPLEINRAAGTQQHCTAQPCSSSILPTDNNPTPLFLFPI
jgi:hypothetical protein